MKKRSERTGIRRRSPNQLRVGALARIGPHVCQSTTLANVCLKTIADVSGARPVSRVSHRRAAEREAHPETWASPASWRPGAALASPICQAAR
jgi:hypothetical protein